MIDFDGNVFVKDTLFQIRNTSDESKILIFDLGGFTTNKILTLAAAITADRTISFPNADTTLAGLTNSQSFNAATPTTAQTINLSGSGSFSGTGLLFADDADAFVTELQRFAGAAADNVVFLPTGADTILVGTDETVDLANKTLVSTCRLNTGTSGSGVAFQDVTTVGKKLRFVLSAASANSHSIQLSNTGTRAYTLRDYTSDAVLVGNTTAAAGTLGRANLTAQTGNIGATTLLTSSANSSGMFRVSFYLKTTTAGSAGSLVKATVAYNDGAAQTADILLTNAIATPAAPAINHDLTINNNDSYGSAIVYADASTAITFTTTGTYNTNPAYTLRARIEALGV